MPNTLTAKSSSAQDINAPRFSIVTKALQADGDATQMRFSAIASSSIEDRAGHEITPAALEKMATRFREGLTIFLNHSKNVPEDVFGTTDGATVKRSGTDAKGSAIWDLEITGPVNAPNPRAVQTWQSIEAGVTLGTSIGAFVLNHERTREGGMIIDDIDVFEASIVGVPMNQRTWVKKALRAIKSFDGGVEDDDTEENDDMAGTTATTLTPETVAKANETHTCTDQCDATKGSHFLGEGVVESTEPPEAAPPTEIGAALTPEAAAGEITDKTLEALATTATPTITKAACPTCGGAKDAGGCKDDYHASTAEKSAEATGVTTDVQEAAQASPESASDTKPNGVETSPPEVEKVATVSADDVAALVKKVPDLIAEINRLRTENAELRNSISTGQPHEVQQEIDAAKAAIEKVMTMPLRRKAVDVVEGFVDRFPQYDSRIAKYLNERQETK